MDPEQKKELYSLLNALCEGLLNKEEHARLDAILETDRQACEIYIDFTSIWSDLRYFQTSLYSQNEKRHSTLQRIIDNSEEVSDSIIWRALALDEKEAPAIEIPHEEPRRELIQKVVYDKNPSRVNKLNLIVAISSVAALLLIVVGIPFLPSKPVPRPVASITSSIHAQWSKSNETYAAGTRLWNDGSWYRLNRGIAELTFDSGAKVLIESPSQFQVLNQNEMFLQGILTAQVPASANGFTVNTSNSRITDLGTEFGVLSSGQSGTEVHVRKGKVQIGQVDSGRRNSVIRLIEAGQGGQVSSSGAISGIEYEKDKFYWEMPAPYVYAVKKTRPLYYWRFEGDQNRILKNEMLPQTEPDNVLSGRLIFDEGPAISDDQSNQALYFSGDKDSYVVFDDNPGDYRGASGLSISMWIHPDVSKPQDIIVHRNKESRSVHTDEITLTEDNCVRFYIFCPPDAPQPWPYDLRVKGYHEIRSNPIPLNQWTHIVAAYTYEGTMNLYINGQLVAGRKLSSRVELYPEVDCWYIGSQWQDFQQEIEAKPGNLIGSVDEISRYNRELSAEEVRILYESAEQRQ